MTHDPCEPEPLRRYGGQFRRPEDLPSPFHEVVLGHEPVPDDVAAVPLGGVPVQPGEPAFGLLLWSERRQAAGSQPGPRSAVLLLIRPGEKVAVLPRWGYRGYELDPDAGALAINGDDHMSRPIVLRTGPLAMPFPEVEARLRAWVAGVTEAPIAPWDEEARLPLRGTGPPPLR